MVPSMDEESAVRDVKRREWEEGGFEIGVGEKPDCVKMVYEKTRGNYGLCDDRTKLQVYLPWMLNLR